MIRTISTTTEVQAELATVFDFFADPKNLEKITPDFLKFTIIDPIPDHIEDGTHLYYNLKIRGVPVKWISIIKNWNPPHGFVDSQIRGPYRLWVHTHRFEQKGNTVVIRDEVKYKVPGWIFEPLIHKLFVARDLEKIFAFRNQMYKKYIAEIQAETKQEAIINPSVQ